jgi:6-phosphogluconate dehydrogenase (decarboxylating)
VGRNPGKRLKGCHSLKEMVDSLKSPRKIFMMVKAGPAVDDLIRELIPLCSPGDILIDGGNTYFPDTNRRTVEVEKAGLLFCGTGVSGGEEGALKGPSIMPGGSPASWPHVKEILQKISAKVGPKHDIPCCEWVGPAGAGHYVKMVHNGIEYGDMQLICEAYLILKSALGLSNAEMYQVFKGWNEGELESYLIEITRDILTVPDPEGTGELVDKILDTAAQKGTGKWMSQHALDLGVPTTLITESVFARCLSAQQPARVRASKVFPTTQKRYTGDPAGVVRLEDLQLRPGVCATRGGGPRVWLGSELRQHLAAVAWRVHYPRPLSRGHQAGLRKERPARKPAARRLLRRGDPQGRTGLAARRFDGGRTGVAGARVHRGPVVLRRISLAAAARESVAGPA